MISKAFSVCFVLFQMRFFCGSWVWQEWSGYISVADDVGPLNWILGIKSCCNNKQKKKSCCKYIIYTKNLLEWIGRHTPVNSCKLLVVPGKCVAATAQLGRFTSLAGTLQTQPKWLVSVRLGVLKVSYYLAMLRSTCSDVWRNRDFSDESVSLAFPL